MSLLPRPRRLPPLTWRLPGPLIEQKNAAFTKAHVDGDVAALDAMFTRDATSLPPGGEPAVGPAAINALTVDFLKAGIKTFTERTWKIQTNIWIESPALARQ